MKKVILITLTFTLHLFANENSIDLQNIKIETPTQTNKNYEKKEDFLVEPKLEDNKPISKKDDDKISLDGGVDFNKEEKSIDGAKVNIGVKF